MGFREYLMEESIDLGGQKLFGGKFHMRYVREMGNYAIFPKGKTSAGEGGSITITPDKNKVNLQITDNDGEIVLNKTEKLTSMDDESVLDFIDKYESQIIKFANQIKW